MIINARQLCQALICNNICNNVQIHGLHGLEFEEYPVPVPDFRYRYRIRDAVNMKLGMKRWLVAGQARRH